jgi:hypothetical protein
VWQHPPIDAKENLSGSVLRWVRGRLTAIVHETHVIEQNAPANRTGCNLDAWQIQRLQNRHLNARNKYNWTFDTTEYEYIQYRLARVGMFYTSILP